MALITAYNTGTASVANGSKAVTGVGTAWLDIGLTAGDVFWNANGTASQRIDTVTDNTHMTLVNNWGGTTLSSAAYEVRITPPSASIVGTVRSLLELLANGVLSGLAALTATSGNVIQSVSGAWASVSPSVMLKTLLTTDGDVPLNSSGTVVRASIASALAKVLTTAGDWLYNDSGTVVRKTSAEAASLIVAALADNAISGNKVHSGVISDFASTGIDDNATATRITISSGGFVGIGDAAPAVPMSVKGAAVGGIVSSVSDGTASATIIKSVNGLGGGENAGACVLVVRKDATTGRSINSAGTNNASGADYADYYFKADGCGAIQKGQAVGFDASGLVTDKWTLAKSFGIKSTAPSVAGGDTWGSPDNLGLTEPVFPNPPSTTEPVAPVAPADPVDDGRIRYDDLQAAVAAYPALQRAFSIAKKRYAVDLEKFNAEAAALASAKALYEKDRAAFDAAYEAQRQKVDRIAVAGKVPAIVSGPCSPGDWIIPAEDGDGIKLVAVADDDISFPQYRMRIGRVLVANPTAAQFASLVGDVPQVPGWTAIIDVVKG